MMRLINEKGINGVVDALIYHLQRGKRNWDYQKFPTTSEVFKGGEKRTHIFSADIPKTDEKLSISINKMFGSLPQISILLKSGEKKIWKRVSLSEEDFEVIKKSKVPVTTIGEALFFNVFPQVNMTPTLEAKLKTLRSLMVPTQVVTTRLPKKITPSVLPLTTVKEEQPMGKRISEMAIFRINNLLTKTNAPLRGTVSEIRAIARDYKLKNDELLSIITYRENKAAAAAKSFVTQIKQEMFPLKKTTSPKKS